MVISALDLTVEWVGAGVAALVVFALVAVWLIPRRQARRWHATGISGKELAELENAFRGTVVQVLGGFALLLTFVATWAQLADTREATEQTLRLTASQQVEERFSRAAQQLARKEPEARLGGIYGLEAVASESAPHRAQVVQILLAYLRSHHKRDEIGGSSIFDVPPAQPVCELPTDRFLPEDRQAAFMAVAGLSEYGPRRNLTRTNLSFVRAPGAKLVGVDVADAAFIHGHLENARFDRANLIRTSFERACLRGASLTHTIEAREAVFDGADLRGATLSGKWFWFASFQWADLRGADLSRTDVTKSALRGAITDDCTRLPWRRRVPDRCAGPAAS
jgi:hypothetical protein